MKKQLCKVYQIVLQSLLNIYINGGVRSDNEKTCKLKCKLRIIFSNIVPMLLIIKVFIAEFIVHNFRENI